MISETQSKTYWI